MAYDQIIDAVCERLSFPDELSARRSAAYLQRLFGTEVTAVNAIREPFVRIFSKFPQYESEYRENIDWKSANPNEAVIAYVLGLTPRETVIKILSDDIVSSMPVIIDENIHNDVMLLSSQPLAAVEILYINGLIYDSLYDSAKARANTILEHRSEKEKEKRRREEELEIRRSRYRHVEVTVYVKPWCVQCNATYRALSKMNIEYEVIDVTEDETALAHVLALGYQQVPVVETSTEHWSGYRPDKIKSIKDRMMAKYV